MPIGQYKHKTGYKAKSNGQGLFVRTKAWKELRSKQQKQFWQNNRTKMIKKIKAGWTEEKRLLHGQHLKEFHKKNPDAAMIWQTKARGNPIKVKAWNKKLSNSTTKYWKSRKKYIKENINI